MASKNADEPIKFYVNEKEFTVDNGYEKDMLLVDFLRNEAALTGTKFMCRRGGCGACIVTIEKFDPLSRQMISLAANACLIPLYACAGLRITTVEGLGNSRKGYHQIQYRLVNNFGTQCGYCSPGMVMSMYSLLKNNTKPSQRQIEDAFDGNICRCTGFRPIIDAMKSFSTPSIKDIEDLHRWKINGDMNGSFCSFNCTEEAMVPLCTKLKDGVWWRPQTLKQLYGIMKDLGKTKVRLVSGNTGIGLFRDDTSDFFIDVRGIKDLNQFSRSDPYTIGANVTLSQLITHFSNFRSQSPVYSSRIIVDALKTIANVPVRNLASWAGNLIMKRDHAGFQSDVFTLLEALGAKLTIGHITGVEKSVDHTEFLKEDAINGYIIKNMVLPTLTNRHYLDFHKTRQRSQNCHAYVNAAFRMELDSRNNYRIMSKPILVYGGVAPEFVHASKTEQYLTGKQLANEDTLKTALELLSKEVEPNVNPVLSSSEYRKMLLMTLFYKTVLKFCKDKVDKRFVSGGENIFRPISSSSQDFSTNEKNWPMTKPIPKLESKAQCSGELKYTTDLPRPKDTLYGAFVLSTIAKGNIRKMDADEALKMPGVVQFITSKDIPGQNNIYIKTMWLSSPQELFSSGEVQFAGQPLGLIVADTDERAKAAARKVKVQYTNVQKPILTIQDSIKAGKVMELSVMILKEGDAEEVLSSAKNKIEGEVQSGHQYHFYMETQVAMTIPFEDGVEVISSTQWVTGIQGAVAQMLNIDKSRVIIPSQYVGGGFGGKLAPSSYVACASAVAAHTLYRPVYVQMDLDTCMRVIGFRNPILAKYEAAFQDDGTLDALKIKYYVDSGYTYNHLVVAAFLALLNTTSVYKIPNFLYVPYGCLTDTANHNAVRAPGSINGVFVIETIMEHIATHLRIDPLAVRQKNLMNQIPYMNSKNMPPKMYSFVYDFENFFNKLLTSADVNKRKQEVTQFNKNNRWRKKGISVVPTKWNVDYHEFILQYSAAVTIFTGGGSVVVAHGGAEIGQGINSKAAQVCAYLLKIPLELISVKLASNVVIANSMATGGAIASELVCEAVRLCCEELKQRMEPVKAEMSDAKWEELIDKCYEKGVNLTANAIVGPANYPTNYPTFGAACTEAEVDILTGHIQINRADLLFDAGESLSPGIDIGQVEGCFVMGLGFYLTEEIRYDPETGANLVFSTGEYFPPTSKDIPVDFRVTLLKDAPNPSGVLSSKATGEPPLLMSTSAFMAVKSAIAAAREEQGDTEWFQLNAPATPEHILMACKLDPKYFTLNEAAQNTQL